MDKDLFRHGVISWTELMTDDPDGACRFYADLFGWTYQTHDMGEGPYHEVRSGERSMGGIMQTPPAAAGQPPQWGLYVTVDDIDATAARCGELGGSVLVPPMDIPTVGRFAVLRDPQGAVFQAITYATEADGDQAC